jgi:hypothetical protein
MTMAAAEKTPGPSEAPARPVLLVGDDRGSWTLSGQDNRARRFADFEAALDSARHVPNSQTSTIEVWQSGEYICCLPPEEWPHPEASVHAAPASEESAFPTAERYANRAAQLLMATAGPLFWLALMVVTLAASLGWRLILL